MKLPDGTMPSSSCQQVAIGECSGGCAHTISRDASPSRFDLPSPRPPPSSFHADSGPPMLLGFKAHAEGRCMHYCHSPFYISRGRGRRPLRERVLGLMMDCAMRGYDIAAMASALSRMTMGLAPFADATIPGASIVYDFSSRTSQQTRSR